MTDALAVDLAAPCWVFRGKVNNSGYGSLSSAGKKWMAHRYMWTLMRGPIPEKMQVDHLCRVRRCLNPQHMEIVDCRTNLLRGTGASAQHARKVACPKCGKPYDYIHPNGSRRCRSCQQAMQKDRYNRRRQGLSVRPWIRRK